MAVLIVGRPSRMLRAVAELLERRHVSALGCSPVRSGALIRERHPELVLLVHGSVGESVSCLSAVHALRVPLVLLSTGSVLETALDAQSIGATTVIAQSPSVDALSARIVHTLEELRAAQGRSPIEPVELSVNELIEGTRLELMRALSPLCESDVADTRDRFGFGDLRTTAALIREFAGALSGLAQAVPRISETSSFLDAMALDAPHVTDSLAKLLKSERDSDEPLEKLRLLIVDDHVARADGVAQALRDAGASVFLLPTRAGPEDVSRVRRLDPHAVLIDEDWKPETEVLMAALKRHPRLRWASAVVVRLSSLWSDDRGVWDISALMHTLRSLTEPEHSVVAQAMLGQPFGIELETMGAPRLLRVLADCERATHLTFLSERGVLRVDLSSGLVAGAQLEKTGAAKIEGTAALAVLLAKTHGSVQLCAISEPQLTSVLSPVEIALDQAEAEASALATTEEAPSVVATYRLHSETPLAVRPVSSRAPMTLGGEIPRAPRVPSQLDGLETVRPLAPWLKRGLTARAGWVAAGVTVLAVIVVSSLISTTAQNQPSARPPAATLEPSKENSAVVAASRLKGSSSPEDSNAPPTESSATGAGTTSSATRGPESSSPSEALEGEDAGEATPLELCNGTLAEKPKQAVDSSIAQALTADAARLINTPRVEEAEALLCGALDKDPGFEPAYKQLAITFLQSARPQSAHAVLERALSLSPRDRSLVTLQADAHALSGDLSRALELLAPLYDTTPGDAPKLRGLSLHFQQQAQQAQSYKIYERAARLFRRAFVLDPQNATAAAGAAQSLLDAGRPSIALRWAQRAVAADAQHPGARTVLDEARRVMK